MHLKRFFYPHWIFYQVLCKVTENNYSNYPEKEKEPKYLPLHEVYPYGRRSETDIPYYEVDPKVPSSLRFVHQDNMHGLLSS